MSVIADNFLEIPTQPFFFNTSKEIVRIPLSLFSLFSDFFVMLLI